MGSPFTIAPLSTVATNFWLSMLRAILNDLGFSMFIITEPGNIEGGFWAEDFSLKKICFKKKESTKMYLCCAHNNCPHIREAGWETWVQSGDCVQRKLSRRGLLPPFLSSSSSSVGRSSEPVWGGSGPSPVTASSLVPEEETFLMTRESSGMLARTPRLADNWFMSLSACKTALR